MSAERTALKVRIAQNKVYVTMGHRVEGGYTYRHAIVTDPETGRYGLITQAGERQRDDSLEFDSFEAAYEAGKTYVTRRPQ
ncbi:MAG: hypothetical protein QM729_21235 [Solirubrobacterales bacterium]